MLVDGIAAGVWDSRRTSKGLSITIDPFERLSPAERAAMATAAESIGAAQGLPTTIGFGRVFAQKGSKLTVGPADA